LPVNKEAPAELKKAIEAKGDLRKVALKPRVPDRAVYLSTEMSPKEQVELLVFLNKNSDVFMWSTSDLVGVSSEIIEHKLQVNSNVKPKKKKLCKLSKEKIEAAEVEVQRLLHAGFIHEVVYPQWLANVVMVRKKNGKC
jgi:hypothetical protein